MRIAIFILVVIFFNFVMALPVSLTEEQRASKSKKDTYKNFAELEKAYKGKPTPFEIQLQKKSSPVLVLGIHGGTIEMGTDKMVKAIAKNEFSYYVFKGLEIKDSKADKNPDEFRELHITSVNFDEPQALKMVKEHDDCVSIHGFNSIGNIQKVCMGGANYALRDKVSMELKKRFQGLPVEICPVFMGNHAENIVNRCRNFGVQIETSRQFRERLMGDERQLENFVAAIHSALAQPISRHSLSYPVRVLK